MMPDRFVGDYVDAASVEPKEKLVGIMMIQVPAIAGNDYRRAMRYLTYQALTDKVE
jgi:hypothetical protein